MSGLSNYKRCISLALAVTGIGLPASTASAGPSGPDDAVQGVNVLTRGPVHEAFAGTVVFDPEPGVVAPNAPGDIIEEVPPDQRPEGVNVSWIPGYWAWDDERSDFLWVSGIWRAVPPGRQWVPGYWGQVTRGYQWTAGYWGDDGINETEYLPEPPATIEVGPNTPASAANLGWVPGCWIWRESRYAWRPGYWAAGRPDWDWIPAHYTWAPRGYIYCNGYWDHSIARRGVLFAPVYFDRSIHTRADFHYSPSIVINLGVFTDQLFLRPRYQHYYFGDYYAVSYQNAGYCSPFSSQSRRYGYDPIYARDRWEHRRDRDWEHRAQAAFAYRRDHADARPPRTLRAQREMSSRGVTSAQTQLVMATSLGELAQRKDHPLRLQPVVRAERQSLARLGREIQAFRGKRQQLEAPVSAAPAQRTVKAVAPVRLILPKPLVASKPPNQLGKDQTPPKKQQVPKPDMQNIPKPRQAAVVPRVQEPKAKSAELKPPPPPATPKEKSKGGSTVKPKNDTQSKG